jgi:serine/threonine protein kinase
LSGKIDSPQLYFLPPLPGGGPSSLKKTSSFTMLDPTSGIPSPGDNTPRMQASLTSRQSYSNRGDFTQQRPVAPMNGGRRSMAYRLKPTTPTMLEVYKCLCFGKSTYCTRCNHIRPHQKVARAGTPGFRPPEVLLKSEHQSTAVDIWAAGVIFLCMLSRTYPFFRAQDDMHALAEIMTLMGTEEMVAVASQGRICQYLRVALFILRTSFNCRPAPLILLFFLCIPYFRQRP